MYIKTLIFFLISLPAFGEGMPILEERDWTSKDGRIVKATLVKAEDLNITLKMAKDNKLHTLELDRLSDKDRVLVSDSQDKAAKIIEDHNSKVKNVVWYSDWHFRNSYSGVPELEIDELRLVYYFGKARELGVFAVKFTPDKFKLETNKVNALMMGSEGFAVKAKTAAEWSFIESGKDLNVRPKVMSKGSSDRVEVAYANGVTVRLLFANGRSITEGEMGIQKCLILALENFEPRFAR
jgi:hypothetical protein